MPFGLVFLAVQLYLSSYRRRGRWNLMMKKQIIKKDVALNTRYEEEGTRSGLKKTKIKNFKLKIFCVKGAGVESSSSSPLFILCLSIVFYGSFMSACLV
jgi:hypothetical protein